jgi:transcriptional regulator with XRE-family HTH domain
MEELPARLKRLRKAAGLTQAGLARAAGVVQSTIGNIESGTRGYGESLVDIAKVLRVPPEYLRCETDSYAVLDASLPLLSGDMRSDAKDGGASHTSEETLRALGQALEAADAPTRKSALDMLKTYLENPSGNADLLPLIARRLSGEPPEHKISASGGAK